MLLAQAIGRQLSKGVRLTGEVEWESDGRCARAR